MMDIPYPWNVMTGVGCLAVLAGFFAWLHVTDRRLRTRLRSWAETRGWTYEFPAGAVAPTTGAPFTGVFRLRHRLVGDVDGRSVTVAEYRHDRPVRTATVVVSTPVSAAVDGFDVAADASARPDTLPEGAWEEIRAAHGDDPTVHYRSEAGLLTMIRRDRTITTGAAASDAARLARVAAVLDAAAPSKAAPH